MKLRENCLKARIGSLCVSSKHLTKRVIQPALYLAFFVFVSCSQSQYKPESLDPYKLVWLYQYYVESCGPKRPGMFDVRIEVIQIPDIDYLKQQSGYERLGAFSYEGTRLISTKLIIDPARRWVFELQINTYATELKDSILWAVFPVCELPDVVENDAVQKVFDVRLNEYDPFGMRLDPPEPGPPLPMLIDAAAYPSGILTVDVALSSNSVSSASILLYGLVTKDGETYLYYDSADVSNSGEQSAPNVSLEVPVGVYSIRCRLQSLSRDSTFVAFAHDLIVKRDIETNVTIDSSAFLRYANRKIPVRQ